jgi:peptide methionine sulfoxide reductase MsrA
MGDHTECFEVDFDPAVVAYDDLLELFWTSHDPTRQAWKTQYASLILTRGDEQLAQAQASAERFSAVVKHSVATRIEPLDVFWLAEDYHQKYYLRNDRVIYREIRASYPREDEFIASTAAARMNGYLYGVGSCIQLKRDLPALGLSDEGAEHLRTHCRR